MKRNLSDILGLTAGELMGLRGSLEGLHSRDMKVDWTIAFWIDGESVWVIGAI